MRDPGKFLKATLLVVVAVMTFFASVLASSAVLAADRVVVIHAEGPDSDAIAKDVKSNLPKGLVAGDPKEFNGELGKQGQKGAFGKALDNSKQREKLLDRVRKAAKASSVDVVIILRVKKDKQGRTVTILVIDPKTPAPLREDEVTLPPKKGKDDSKPVVASIGPALGASSSSPPPEPEKKPEKATPTEEKKPEKAEKTEEKEEEKEQEKKPEPPAGKRPSGEYNRALFIGGLGVDLGLRRFEYNQPITKNLRAYSVSGAPMLTVNVELYPLAGSGGPVGDFGIVGLYSRALALQSAPQGGQKFSTTWDRWFAGLRYRIRTSGDSGPLVGITVGYGHEGFTFSGMPDALASEVPAQAYGYVKIAADARIPVGPLALMAGAGYLVTSASGSDATSVAGRFSRAKVGGIEATAGVGLTLAKGLEARALVRYTRFFWSMNPELGDTYIAGGAVDTFASLHLGVAYAF
ncbi:MAG: hypothetical protein ACXVEF_32730 [Polyangiales bacterium]